MKKQLTIREKVLLAILAVLMVVCLYNYAFYLPMTRKLEALKLEQTSLEEQAALVDANVAKMQAMKAELEAIQSGSQEVKPLPKYNNGKALMDNLSKILAKADTYRVGGFDNIIEEENMVRRNVSITYSCVEYATAKEIFTAIHDGEFRCLIKDFHITMNDGYSVTMTVTYFEYK